MLVLAGGVESLALTVGGLEVEVVIALSVYVSDVVAVD
jgi:hypothetical protein